MNPLTLHISPSLACNNGCVFCLDRGRRAFPGRSRFAGLYSRALAKYGKDCAQAVFTGFDPTMSPDLPELARQARAAGVRRLWLQTNGWRLADGKYLASLVKAGVTGFSLSIHGSCAAVHDACTRRPGSFARAAAALRSLLKLKKLLPWLEVKTTSVICALNLADFRALARRLTALPGLSHSGFNPVVFAGDGLRNSAKLFVRFSDIASGWRAFLAGAPPGLRARAGFTGLPACVLPEADYNSGRYEDIVCVNPAGSKFVRRSGGYGRKRAACRRCRYFAGCPGIHEVYLRRYGWGEFVPVKAAPGEAA